LNEHPRIEPAPTPGATRLPPALAAELFEESLHAVPTIDLRDIGARLLAPLVHATGARRASLMLVNPETGKLRIVAGLGLNAELIGRDVDWRPNSISEWVFRKRRGLVLNGAIKQEGLVGTAEGVIDTAMCVPLENEEYMLGVLNVASTGTAPAFTEADLAALHAMLPPVAAAIERALHANLCSRNTDRLMAATGLKDRTLLAPGRYEGRNYEMGFARLSSAYDGGTVCERVPLANGGQVLLALYPRVAGVDALLSAAFAQGVFAGLAATERSAAAVAARLNTELCARLGDRGEMGAWIGQLSPSGQLTSCTAGYSAPLWVPADDSPVTHLGTGGPMVGAAARALFEEEQVRLLPGDMVVIVSSGVLGARNVTGQPFGPERLYECIAERRRQELDTLAEGIVHAVVSWTGRPVPTDDLSVLAVRFAPGG
jgi:hypothetical protein